MVNMQTCFGALVFGVLAITPVSAQQFCAGYGCGDRYGYGWRDTSPGWGARPYVEPYRPYYAPGRERHMDRRDYRYDRRYDRREDRYDRWDYR